MVSRHLGVGERGLGVKGDGSGSTGKSPPETSSEF